MNPQSFYEHHKNIGPRLTSVFSLELGALLPLLVVSLAGTTVICCIGMLLFPSNAPVLLPRHSQHATPSRPLIRVPASHLLSHPQAVFGVKEVLLPGTLSFISPIRFIQRSGDGTGSGHRGNWKTALEMAGCEVVMAIGKLLGVPHPLAPPPPLPSR